MIGQELSFQMKCVWAEYHDNDTSYCLTNELGKVINVHIHEDSKHASIGVKTFEKIRDLSYSSASFEIDYWLFYTNCDFNDDYSKLQWKMHDERMKQFNGKWKNEIKYYSSDLNSPVFSSKEEFELKWKEQKK